jgi:hypothetical protein
VRDQVVPVLHVRDDGPRDGSAGDLGGDLGNTGEVAARPPVSAGVRPSRRPSSVSAIAATSPRSAPAAARS